MHYLKILCFCLISNNFLCPTEPKYQDFFDTFKAITKETCDFLNTKKLYATLPNNITFYKHFEPSTNELVRIVYRDFTWFYSHSANQTKAEMHFPKSFLENPNKIPDPCIQKLLFFAQQQSEDDHLYYDSQYSYSIKKLFL